MGHQQPLPCASEAHGQGRSGVSAAASSVSGVGAAFPSLQRERQLVRLSACPASPPAPVFLYQGLRRAVRRVFHSVLFSPPLTECPHRTLLRWWSVFSVACGCPLHPEPLGLGQMTLNLSGGLTLVSMVVLVIILPFVSQNKRKLLSPRAQRENLYKIKVKVNDIVCVYVSILQITIYSILNYGQN